MRTPSLTLIAVTVFACSETLSTGIVNQNPVAVLFNDFGARAGSPVELDGSQSYDPDGGALTLAA